MINLKQIGLSFRNKRREKEYLPAEHKKNSNKLKKHRRMYCIEAEMFYMNEPYF